MFVREIICRTAATQYAASGTVSPVLAGFCRLLQKLSVQQSFRYFHYFPAGLRNSERHPTPPIKKSWITEDLLEQPDVGSSLVDLRLRGQSAPRDSFENANFDHTAVYKKSLTPGRVAESK
jgi:hypothetical protein